MRDFVTFKIFRFIYSLFVTMLELLQYRTYQNLSHYDFKNNHKNVNTIQPSESLSEDLFCYLHKNLNITTHNNIGSYEAYTTFVRFFFICSTTSYHSRTSSLTCFRRLPYYNFKKNNLYRMTIAIINVNTIQRRNCYQKINICYLHKNLL